MLCSAHTFGKISAKGVEIVGDLRFDVWKFLFFCFFFASRMTLLDLGADEGNTLSESFELSGKVK